MEQIDERPIDIMDKSSYIHFNKIDYIDEKIKLLNLYSPILNIPDVIFQLIATFAVHSKFNELLHAYKRNINTYHCILHIPEKFVEFNWYRYTHNIQAVRHHLAWGNGNGNCYIAPAEIYKIEVNRKYNSYRNIFSVTCNICKKQDPLYKIYGQTMTIKKSDIIYDGVVRVSFISNNQTFEMIIS